MAANLQHGEWRLDRGQFANEQVVADKSFDVVLATQLAHGPVGDREGR